MKTQTRTLQGMLRQQVRPRTLATMYRVCAEMLHRNADPCDTRYGDLSPEQTAVFGAFVAELTPRRREVGK